MGGILRVVIGPGVDVAAADEVLSRAARAREVAVELVRTASVGELAAAVRAAIRFGEFVVVPGLADIARAGEFVTMPGLADAPDAEVLRVDFDQCEPDRSPGVRTHIRGRGPDGLRYALDSWYFRRFHPPAVVAYGPHPQQRVEMRFPPGAGPFPVAVLIHGGYWKPWWDSDLMDAMAVDLTARGYLTGNVEYRRPAEFDWAAMTSDVTAACATITTTPRADLNRLAVLGHSAGAQLAFRMAADAEAVHPALLVSLAGVLDLRTADLLRLGDGAVSAAIGHRYSDMSEVYHQSSPIERLPIGVPQLVVCGLDDEPELLDMSRDYVERARASDGRVSTLEAPGDHFAVIDPNSEIWPRIIELL